MPPAPRSTRPCPHCGKPVEEYRNPLPTVDVLIAMPLPDGREGVVLIKRRNDPPGWAIPGGFVEYGETVETTAVREMQEETSLALEDLRFYTVRSDPARDPRHHTITVIFTARGRGTPRAGDDAADIGVFPSDQLPEPLAFDHRAVLEEDWRGKQGADTPPPEA